MSVIIREQFHKRTGEFGKQTWAKWFTDYLQLKMNGWDEEEYLALVEALGPSEEIYRMRHTLRMPIPKIMEQTGLGRRMVYYHLSRARKFREEFWRTRAHLRNQEERLPQLA